MKNFPTEMAPVFTFPEHLTRCLTLNAVFFRMISAIGYSLTDIHKADAAIGILRKA